MTTEEEQAGHKVSLMIGVVRDQWAYIEQK